MMYRISFKPSFIRRAKRLGKEVFEEVVKRIELLKDQNNHATLRVHKLHGELANHYSFSVNFDIRIIFKFEFKDEIVLLQIGRHDIYK